MQSSLSVLSPQQHRPPHNMHMQLPVACWPPLQPINSLGLNCFLQSPEMEATVAMETFWGFNTTQGCISWWWTFSVDSLLETWQMESHLWGRNVLGIYHVPGRLHTGYFLQQQTQTSGKDRCLEIQYQRWYSIPGTVS